MQHDYEELLNRAKSAYFRFPGEGGQIQPSNDSAVEEYDGKVYVVLRNINRVLRVYRVRNDGKLKALKRWPLSSLEQYEAEKSGRDCDQRQSAGGKR